MPCTTNVNARRARVAALARFRDSADPELVEARLRLHEERFVAAVERALNDAPPPSIAKRRDAQVGSVSPILLESRR